MERQRSGEHTRPRVWWSAPTPTRSSLLTMRWAEAVGEGADCHTRGRVCSPELRTRALTCIARTGVLNYAGVVFARILLVIALMFVLDVAWWVAALRLTKPKLGRILASVFMACQMAGLLAFIAGRWWHVEWLRLMPKSAWAAVVIWHFFAL